MLPDPTSSSSNHKTRTLNLLPLLPCHYSSLLAESCSLGICLLLHHFSGAFGADPPSDVLDTRQRCDRLQTYKIPTFLFLFLPLLILLLNSFFPKMLRPLDLSGPSMHTHIFIKEKQSKLGIFFNLPSVQWWCCSIRAYPNAKIGRAHV